MPSTLLLRSKVGVAVAIILALVLAVAAATEPAFMQELDERLLDWMRGWGAHRFFLTVTHVGSINGAIVIALVAAAALWKRCRALALAFPALVAVAIATDVTLKLIIDRGRPLDPLVGTNFGSFPSGHVIMAVAVLGLLVPTVWIVTRSRRWFWFTVALFVGGVALVSLSRVNLGAHWPSDVLGSVLVGSALLLLAEYVLASSWACRRCAGCALHVAS